MKKRFVLILSILSLFMFSSILQAQTRWVIVPGTAFKHVVDWDDFTVYYGDFRKVSSTGAGVAAVYFPESAHGKLVTRMSVSYMDNNPGGHVDVKLWKKDLYTGLRYIVFHIQSSGEGDASFVRMMHDDIGTLRRIDNSRWSWYLESNIVFQWTNLIVHSVRIAYN